MKSCTFCDAETNFVYILNAREPDTDTDINIPNVCRDCKPEMATHIIAGCFMCHDGPKAVDGKYECRAIHDIRSDSTTAYVYYYCSLECKNNDIHFHRRIKTMFSLNTTLAKKCCNYCKLISSDLKCCSNCKNTWYCSSECQKANWKKHKKDCIHRITT